MNAQKEEFLPNLQILANAGSGKTHTLVTRIVRLLAQGVEPRRIIALTFTRKAAGEFLSKLLQRLADASLDSKNALELSSATGINKSCSEYQKMLRIVVEEIGSLQLTTLDSFFSRVAASFPQELGLVGPPTLLDPQAEELAGKNSLRHALTNLDTLEQDLLLQAMLERDEGSAPASAGRDLQNFRREVHEEFTRHPEPEAWGNPQRIWGMAGNPWKPLTAPELKALRKTVENEKGTPEFPNKTRDAWKSILTLQRGSTINKVVGQILENLSAWKTGSGEFIYNRITYTPSAAAQQAATALMEHYINECTDYRLRESRAVYHLLSLYEREYSAGVRNRGELTFSDITNLLQPGDGFSGMGIMPTTQEELFRLQLDERLDSFFDHWLLDEFQDTSRSQYRALENILDEVISEGARSKGHRSFFCVGDIKQAIYGWRKGDVRLFDEIYHRYGSGVGGLVRKSLSKSWRSANEVLETLNAVFGDLSATASGLPERVLKRWLSAWADHEGAGETSLSGYVSWEMVEGENDAEKKEEIQNRVVSVINVVKSKLAQGMTIALLVRTSREANEWLEILRFAGIEALSESNPPVGRDNPVAAALRSALSLTAHPEDSLALGHLSMEPLGAIFFPGNNPKREIDNLIKDISSRLAEGGFAAATKWILEKLSPLVRDTFSRDRASSLRSAALNADESGITDIDDFLSFLSDYSEPGRSAPRAVQVMTVHKAKGLEYDMVLLPLSGRQEALTSIGNERIGLWENAQGEPFLMKLPSEAIRSVAGNEVLALAAELKREDRAFEELCVWYVAMSRAKQALYIFGCEPKPVEQDASPNFPQLLVAGFRQLEGFDKNAIGDPEWHEKFAVKSPDPDPDPLPQKISVEPRATALQKNLPSDLGHSSLLGLVAFSERTAATFGTLVHELFEAVDWLDQPWKAPAHLSSEAVSLMTKCFGTGSVKKLFAKPLDSFLLWREKRFDILDGGSWISGCFDRVVIHRDAAGKAVSAELIDFKTDKCTREELVADYTPQLESYRRALSILLNIPEDKIRMILLQIRAEDPVVEIARTPHIS